MAMNETRYQEMKGKNVDQWSTAITFGAPRIPKKDAEYIKNRDQDFYNLLMEKGIIAGAPGRRPGKALEPSEEENRTNVLRDALEKSEVKENEGNKEIRINLADVWGVFPKGCGTASYWKAKGSLSLVNKALASLDKDIPAVQNASIEIEPIMAKGKDAKPSGMFHVYVNFTTKAPAERSRDTGTPAVPPAA